VLNPADLCHNYLGGLSTPDCALAVDHNAAPQHNHARWQGDTHPLVRSTVTAWQAICERAITSARVCGDLRAEVCCSTRLVACHIASGNIAAATPDCWRRITSHRRAEAIIHRQLGRALHGLGRPQEAGEHLEAALAIFTELAEDYHQARTLYVVATYMLDGNSPQASSEAISLLERARPLMEAEDHPLSHSELLTTLAQAHARAGHTSKARACLDQATAIHEELRLPGNHPARTRAGLIASQLP
jgi:tetratricopeptide (TPR) repeat protein